MKHYFILITFTIVFFWYANFGYIPNNDGNLIIGLFILFLLSLSLLFCLLIIDIKNYINNKRNAKKRF